MKKLAKEKRLIIPATQLLELLIVAYREKSNRGKLPIEGLKHIQDISNFYSETEELKNLGVNIKFYPVSGRDVIEAARLILRNPEYFTREGSNQTKWLEFIDAITAAIWRETRLTLYTADEKLMNFGEKFELRYEKYI